MTPTFAEIHGFARAEVTLGNWRTAPYNVWAFQNARDLVPSAGIACARVSPEEALDSAGFLAMPIDTGIAGVRTVEGFLAYAHTDSFVVLRKGKVAAEYYAPHSHVNARHLVFSISKSLTALVSGILEAQGVIDPDRPVTAYVPEAAGSAYGDASYRDVLDMRVSLDFEESYLDPLSDFARYRRATLWNPPLAGAAPETLPAFLMTLKKADRPHGGRFFYASPNSDLLGHVIERATGRRFAELLSELIWKPMGARNHGSITVDAIGSPRCAGGISVTARDLARVGEMLRQGGGVDGRQIVQASWIEDMKHNGDRQAWLEGRNVDLPNGRYRSQWYQSGDADGAFCAIGIHGQWLWVDPSTETVIVKMSSQPDPLGDEDRQDIFAFFRSICAMAL